jgi:hypothetical protein
MIVLNHLKCGLFDLIYSNGQISIVSGVSLYKIHNIRLAKYASNDLEIPVLITYLIK